MSENNVSIWDMENQSRKKEDAGENITSTVSAGNAGYTVNTVDAGNTVNAVNAVGAMPQAKAWSPAPAKKQETEYTKRMKQNVGFFGPVTFAYALFYAFCMFHNGSGITFPFFMAGSLLYLCFSLSKLEISLKKGSAFYMISMMLLAVSTFCTDDWRIIAFNKTGIFLLMMSLLLKQFFVTDGWKLGKYLWAICELVFASIGEIGRPFSDTAAYFKSRNNKQGNKIWYAVLGAVIAVPLLLVVLLLLSSADAVFRDLTGRFLENINMGNIFNVVFRVLFLYFASYLLLSYLCKHLIGESVKDKRKGEPILAITVTGLLSLLYLVFSVIQIIYLFLGKMQLPEGYTYASYAREGFFQLLAVSILNLIIVLVAMSFFRESKGLKAILTVMSLCTFIMIASSALRMIIYIRYYYMTFLRILVLWALAVLFFLFVGVIIGIFREKFPLFQYSMVVVTILYTLLSFSHPDYIIASINVANAPREAAADQDWRRSDFFLSEEPYHDYRYLNGLCADAAPVLIPYLSDLGYDLNVFYDENIWDNEMAGGSRERISGFGYYYLEHLQKATENFSLRTFNISRYMALKQIEKYSAVQNDPMTYLEEITIVNETNYVFSQIECEISLNGKYLGYTCDTLESGFEMSREDSYSCSLKDRQIAKSEIPQLALEFKVEMVNGERYALPKLQADEDGNLPTVYALRSSIEGFVLEPMDK